jgi:hypothetical protein
MMMMVMQIGIGACGAGACVMAANLHRWHVDSRWLGVAIPAAAAACMWIVVSAVLQVVPVLDQVRAYQLQAAPGEIRLHLAAVKTRRCRGERFDAYLLGEDGLMHEAPARIVDDPAAGDPKPLGPVDLGTWSISVPAGVRPVAAQIQATHDCGIAWPWVTTSIGPVLLEGAELLSAGGR